MNKDLKNDKKVFKKMYEEDCLENEVLVTSRKTGFSLRLLWEISLDILYLNGSFRCVYFFNMLFNST